METAVLLVVFNRPDVTRQVLSRIRDARPKYLYIAADGPRLNRPDDLKNCAATRSIVDEIDWPCTVKTLFREKNLGCRLAVSSGIDWFFEQVEEGIILEDDCLPHQDFFYFCEEMLALYRNDPRVMHITGGNYQQGVKRGDASYYFSRIAHVWGWASWKRAWKFYDVEMKDFKKFSKSSERSSFFLDSFSERYWMYHFHHVYTRRDTWDYQWAYAVMKNRGYCIIPNVNLISNIGFGRDATHTTEDSSVLAQMPVSSLRPILNASQVKTNDEADTWTISKMFPKLSIQKRIMLKVKKLVNATK